MNLEMNLVELIYELNACVTSENPSIIQIQEQVLKTVDYFFQKPKSNAKLLVSKTSILRVLIDSFRIVKNFEVQQDLIQILFQITNVKFGTKRLVEFFGTEAILESINLFPSAIPENFAVHFILLAKLSDKDPKFSTKFRFFHLTSFLLDNLRYYTNEFDRALPIITVFHRCAVSPTTCVAFRKHFAMRILLCYLGNARIPLHPVVSICIDSIRLLVKNKGILALSSWENLLNELVKFYSFLMFDFENFHEIFNVLDLLKEISRIPRGHAAIINSHLFRTLRDTLAKFHTNNSQTELRDRFVKFNLEIIQDFIRKKHLLYHPYVSYTAVDSHKKQFSLQNQFSKTKRTENTKITIIDKLNLFSENFEETTNSRGFSLTIRSLIDFDSLANYSFTPLSFLETQHYLSELFRIQKPSSITDPKISKFHDNLNASSKYFGYSANNTSISQILNTFLSPTVDGEPSQLYQKEENIMLSIALSKLDIINQPIYSIEKEVFRQKISFTDPIMKPKRNENECTIQSPVPAHNFDESLIFSADFECSNLQKVIEINATTYDVILRPDTTRHVQWFLFKITNMNSATNYTFKIVNFEKVNSQFSSGMQPLIFSRKSFSEHNLGWYRVGTMIYYGDSDYNKRTMDTNTIIKLHSLTFELNFPFDNDECFLAYHYPYTYTNLLNDIRLWENTSVANLYFKIDTLCYSYTGIPCPLITITDLDHKLPYITKEYIVLSSRVHPGESNASWMIKSIIEVLLSDNPIAAELRSKFIFKIVPMLNPDGVIYGNTRCNLLGFDLNRQWLEPSPNLHPTIFYTKSLIQRLIQIGKQPLVFCDFHGHSQKKNLFMYGCSSFSKVETVLPETLARNYSGFDLQSCSNLIEKSKLRCGRVVVGTNLNIPCSYTLEVTYCGYNQGHRKDFQLSLQDFKEIGLSFLKSLHESTTEIENRSDVILQNSYIE